MPKLLEALILLQLFLLYTISFALPRLDVVPGFPGDGWI